MHTNALLLLLFLASSVSGNAAQAAEYSLGTRSNDVSDCFTVPILDSSKLPLISIYGSPPTRPDRGSGFTDLRNSTIQRLEYEMTRAFASRPISTGVKTSPFGWRGRTFRMRTPTWWLSAQPRGSTLQAIGNGTVAYSGWYGAYGKTVIIQYFSGFRMIYHHLSYSSVRTGQMMERGEEIGTASTNFGSLSLRPNYPGRNEFSAWDAP